MIRLAAAALIALAATQAAAQTTPALRTSALISGNIVRIGDLVDNVSSRKAKIAIFRAPNLGETGHVPASSVIDALRPHDVVGVQTGGISEIAVTRASRIVGGDEIRSRVAALLSQHLRVAATADISLTFDRPLQAIHLDPARNEELSAGRVTFEPRSGRFDLTLNSESATPVRLTGVAAEAYDAVVLTRPLARGEIVRAGDVTIQQRPKSDLQSDAFRDRTAAIGLSVRHPLRAGQPLRANDLTKPQLIQRNEPVVLLYEVPGIVLTARGKAEEAGAAGDIVNVLNAQSKRIIQGVVTGPGQVTVTSLTPRIATATANLAAVQPASHSSAARQTTE